MVRNHCRCNVRAVEHRGIVRTTWIVASGTCVTFNQALFGNVKQSQSHAYLRLDVVQLDANSIERGGTRHRESDADALIEAERHWRIGGDGAARVLLGAVDRLQQHIEVIEIPAGDGADHESVADAGGGNLNGDLVRRGQHSVIGRQANLARSEYVQRPQSLPRCALPITPIPPREDGQTNSPAAQSQYPETRSVLRK